MDETTKVRRWAVFLHNIRHFFDMRGYLEVSTDNLVPAGAFESSIDTLKVSFASGTGELHTSPEIAMKGVLAKTQLPIYQICKSYRDDPPTGIHKREFTMLEFYRPHCDYQTTRAEMMALFIALAGPIQFEEITVRDLILKSSGVDIDVADLRPQIEANKVVALAADDTWNDMYFKLLIEKGEPSLDPERPTLVYDYPASQAALAKVNADTGLAERFEIYWKGMELCNGCTELDSVEELKRRYEVESRAREALGKAPHPFPQKLFDAMTTDFPSASGVAVGLDRLFKCLFGTF